MLNRILGAALLVCGMMAWGTCGDSAARQAVAAPADVAPVAAKGLKNIAAFSHSWSELYKGNEKVINAYEGMPIMELVTPPVTFAGSVMYDLLNVEQKEGKFEGTLLSGSKGIAERKGEKITFGSERVLGKDGFGQSAKKGDRVVDSGWVDLGVKYYADESYTEREGKKIMRSYCEFKMLGDGSMICVSMSGQTFNARGEEVLSDSVIYLHNGKNQYDFVVGKAKTGPAFKSMSFSVMGDLSKEKALEAFKAAGYTIEKSGGITDGKLVVDK